jgi:hypothetical protein
LVVGVLEPAEEVIGSSTGGEMQFGMWFFQEITFSGLRGSEDQSRIFWSTEEQAGNRSLTVIFRNLKKHREE